MSDKQQTTKPLSRIAAEKCAKELRYYKGKKVFDESSYTDLFDSLITSVYAEQEKELVELRWKVYDLSWPKKS